MPAWLATRCSLFHRPDKFLHALGAYGCDNWGSPFGDYDQCLGASWFCCAFRIPRSEYARLVRISALSTAYDETGHGYEPLARLLRHVLYGSDDRSCRLAVCWSDHRSHLT